MPIAYDYIRIKEERDRLEKEKRETAAILEGVKQVPYVPEPAPAVKGFMDALIGPLH